MLVSSASRPSGLRRIGAVRLVSVYPSEWLRNARYKDQDVHTECLKLLPEPVQSYDYYCDVDECKIRNHRNQVSVDLLVCCQFF